MEVTDEILSGLGHAVQARPRVAPSEAWQALLAEQARIKAWLGSTPPLRLVRVHELLKRDGVCVGYTTLRRFARREFGWHERPPTVLLVDPPPGEEAQVDFGLMGIVLDADGRRRKLHMLVVTLSLSRYQFVWPTYEQTTRAVYEGLDAAWRFFDGVVKRVVPDNTSSMVLRASSTSPELHPVFREYAEARGLFIDPARVRSLKDKARIENQVPYVRERWFAGERLPTEMSEVRRHAEAWCRDIAGARVHGTTRRVPREAYAQNEKPHMQPAQTEPISPPQGCDAKVHPDHHIQVQKALHSLPTRYIAKTVRVRSDGKVVRMYLCGELIKLHGWQAPGGRSTDPSDCPPHKAPYARRDVNSIVHRGHALGSHLGAFCERPLSGLLPWVKLREGQVPLRLCERYEVERVNALCARALSFDVIEVPRIERMLKDARHIEEQGEQRGQVIPLPSRFLRDAKSSRRVRKARRTRNHMPRRKKEVSDECKDAESGACHRAQAAAAGRDAADALLPIYAGGQAERAVSGCAPDAAVR